MAVKDHAAPMSALQADLVRDILVWLDRTRPSVGSPIRELPLARSFGVSRTPIRSALLALEKLGYVEFEPRRGFVLVRPAAANGVVDDEMLPRSAHERLQQAIIGERAEGVLPPEVSEAELIARYGVSRGIVRRVMMALGDDGLAQRLRGHGWRFSETLDTLKALRESYDFRVVIECAALRQPGFQAKTDEIEALRAAHEDMLKAPGAFDSRAWFTVNSRFHEAIAAWSGNRFILDAMRRQNALRRLGEYREYRALRPENIKRSLRDHLAMLDAIASGDLSWAASLMQRHLEMSARAYEQMGQLASQGGKTRRPRRG